MDLDTKSPIPLFEQLKTILRDEILKGKYEDKIPSERELMERFSVSRSTVRQAILALVNEGVLEKVHGRGTFVSLRPVEEWLGNLTSFNDVVKEMGMKPNTKLINQGITTNPKEVSTVLGLNEFYFIERLRLADEIPIAVERQYYPIEIGEQLAKFDLNNAAIYDLLEKEIGINLWEAQEVITSSMPSNEDAKLLNIEPTACVLNTERFLTDPNGNPVEYETNVFRADMYSFRIKLKRRLTD